MKPEHEKALYKLDHLIDDTVSPSEMSCEEALDFLENLASSLEGKIDGMECDIANAAAGDGEEAP